MTARRGALVGFGAVAEKAHAPALKGADGLSIAAVAEASPERRAAAGRAFPKAEVYGSLEALLKAQKGLDFAVIATPPHLHAAQAAACLAAGLHVLVEKPLGLSPQDVESVHDAARRAGRVAFCVHNWACSPQWAKLIALAPSVGKPVSLELTVERTQPSVSALPGDWRRDAALAGGGILVDHGWHNLYLVCRLLGDEHRSVSVERFSGGPGAAEDEAVVSVRYGRAAARLSLTWRAEARANAAVLEGADGRLTLSDDALLVERGGRPVETIAFAEKLSAGSAHPEWLAALLPEFVSAMDGGPEAARNAAEAAFCANVIAACYAEAREAAPR